jgi:hypothetical protein
VLGVTVGAQEGCDVVGVGDLESDHPPGPVRVGVDQRRIVVESGVHRDHVAVYGTVQIIHCLDRLDGAEHVHLAEAGSHVGELHEHHIAELALGVVGDSDGEDPILVGGPQVLVLLRVVEVTRHIGHVVSPEGRANASGPEDDGVLSGRQPS